MWYKIDRNCTKLQVIIKKYFNIALKIEEDVVFKKKLYKFYEH